MGVRLRRPRVRPAAQRPDLAGSDRPPRAGATRSSFPTASRPTTAGGLTKGLSACAIKGQPRKVDGLGRAARLGGPGGRERGPWIILKPTRPWTRRRSAIEGLSRVRQGGDRGDGVRRAVRHRLHRLLRRGRGQSPPPQFRRAGGKRRKFGRVSLDGRQLPEVRTGPLTPDDLPVDSHELVALCAPRPVFISYGAATGPGAEGQWVDQRGSFLAAVAAGPVYRLLGKKDLGTADFPAVGDGTDRRRDRVPHSTAAAHHRPELADVF